MSTEEKTAEQRVREVWDAKIGIGPYACVVYFNTGIADIERCIHAIGQVHTEAHAWAAALEFTEQRLEEVRQLRREIEWCESGIQQWYSRMYSYPSQPDDRDCDDEGFIIKQAREDATGQRLISRLESILATLTAGMREDV